MTSTTGSTTSTVTTSVAAYLDLVGVDRAAPDRALLDRLVTAHVATIPFENLDPFTGVEPPTTADGVAAKLVHGRRGGWCFEHNRLLHDALADLGLRVTPLVGRVRLGLAAADPPTARTHRLTLVDTVEGRFTVDAGFGSTGPTTALRLVAGWSSRPRRRPTATPASTTAAGSCSGAAATVAGPTSTPSTWPPPRTSTSRWAPGT